MGEERLLERLGVQGRDDEPTVGPAFAVVEHREPALGFGRALLAFEGLGLGGLTDLRADDVEDPVAEDDQVLGVVVLG
nr:hypothetical protein [Nocardioides sp. SYSU D00038]